MKVTRKMIAKDLRFMGFFYKSFLSSLAKKRKKAPEEKRERNTNSSKKIYNVYLKRSDGTKLRVLVKKSESKSDIVVLWLHGGGFVTGAPEMINITMAKEISKKAMVIAPDYRLATYYSFPAALEDSYLTLKWIKENALKLGINKNKIFVGGESAGGGLSVALSLLARDKKEVNIAGIFPLYPMLTNKDTESSKDNNAPVWNEKQNKNAWNLYLNNENLNNKYAIPLLEKDFSSLPPTITFFGEIEIFNSEIKEYIRLLKEFNIDVRYKEFKGCFHAFDMMVPSSKEAKEAKKFFMDNFEEFINKYEAKN